MMEIWSVLMRRQSNAGSYIAVADTAFSRILTVNQQRYDRSGRRKATQSQTPIETTLLTAHLNRYTFLGGLPVQPLCMGFTCMHTCVFVDFQ